MIMADVFKILFLILGTLVTIVAYWLLFRACFPMLVERVRDVYEQRPWRAHVVGTAIAAPSTLFSLGLMDATAGGAKLTGVALATLVAAAGLLGSAGLAVLVGRRLRAGDGSAPMAEVVPGGAVLAASFVLPVLGWFIVLPLTLAGGVGALLLALWRGRRPAAPAAVVAEAQA
jgi:hypothetical protein